MKCTLMWPLTRCVDCPFTATANDSRGWESSVGGMQAGRQAGGCMPLTPSEINAHTYSKELNLWQQLSPLAYKDTATRSRSNSGKNFNQ